MIPEVRIFAKNSPLPGLGHVPLNPRQLGEHPLILELAGGLQGPTQPPVSHRQTTGTVIWIMTGFCWQLSWFSQASLLPEHAAEDAALLAALPAALLALLLMSGPALAPTPGMLPVA